MRGELHLPYYGAKNRECGEEKMNGETIPDIEWQTSWNTESNFGKQTALPFLKKIWNGVKRIQFINHISDDVVWDHRFFDYHCHCRLVRRINIVEDVPY